MKPTRWWQGPVLLLTLFACGGGGGDVPEAGGEAAAEAGEARNACDLVTADEVAAMAGEPVEARPIVVEPAESKCEYWGATNEVPFLGLTVYWTGGREQWDIQAAGYGLAADMIREAEAVELDSIVRPGPVPGLGDAAVFADLLPSLVLKDDILLELYVFYLPEAQKNFRPLAEKILSRL